MNLNTRFADYNALIGLAFPTRWDFTSRGYLADVPDTLTRIAPDPAGGLLMPTMALNTLEIGAGVNPGELGNINILGFGINPATYNAGDPMRLVADTLDANTVGVPTEHQYIALVEVTKESTSPAIANIPVVISGSGLLMAAVGTGTKRWESSMANFPPESVGLVTRWTVRVPPNAPGACAQAQLVGNRQSYTFGSFQHQMDIVRDIQPGQTVVREYAGLPLRHNDSSAFQASENNGSVWVEAVAVGGGTTDIETSVTVYSTTQRNFLENGV